MTLAALFVLLILVVLFTVVQTMFVESSRLRTRELPALQFFKSEFEDRLGIHSGHGAMTFSVWKHACLVLCGVFATAQVVDGGYMSVTVLAESAGLSCLLMMISAYLVPQLLYRRTSGRWLLAFLPVFALASLLLRPVLALLGFLHSLLKITRPEEEPEEAPTSVENIQALIEAGRDEGLIEEDDRQLIQSVVEFGDKVVREIMTPRPQMVTIQADKSLEQLRELVVTEQYSRIPVWESSLDEIIGFVHVRDMFEVAESQRLVMKVRDLMRPIKLVPETKGASDLMREMQQEGGHMAAVIDEYGATVGLVTMEDLVEVILGEIRDEHEPAEDVADDGNGGYVVSGNFDLDRVGEILEFRPGEDVESTTVGGLITEWLGRVPQAGEVEERDGIRIEVLASDEMRVEQVRLSKPREVIA